MRDFVGAFRGAGLRLIVFFDGGVDDAKLDEWLSRRKRDLTNCDKVFSMISALQEGLLDSFRQRGNPRAHATALHSPSNTLY